MPRAPHHSRTPHPPLPSRRRYGHLPLFLGASRPRLRKNNAIRPPPAALTCFGGACFSLPSERSSDVLPLRSPLFPFQPSFCFSALISASQIARASCRE